MIQTYYYESRNTSPIQNLAMEEYLLLHCHKNDIILYLWQNEHTIVLGKNQNAWKECNISKFEEEQGTLVRRLSGGGCVYHDLGNLNFTFIMHKEHYDVQKQNQVILRALQTLGIDAQVSGRNDLLVEGRKFSGHAYYKQKAIWYHHGTLMVDVDVNALSRYLNVSKEKLQAKGVSSVRSRVINLKDVKKDLTIQMLKQSLVASFVEVYGQEGRVLSNIEIDCNAVSLLSEKYASKEWTYGKQGNLSNALSHRFMWGEILLQFQVEDCVIKEMEVYSDAMDSEIKTILTNCLQLCKYEKQAMIQQIQLACLNTEEKNDIISWLSTCEL